MSLFEKLENGFVKVIQALLVIDFCAMVLIVGAQVIIRFVAANAINMSGAEELTRIFLCYLTFLGATLLYESRGHVWVANLVDAVPGPVRKILLLLSYVVQLAFFIIIFVGSSKIFPVVGTQSTSVLHVPMRVCYIGIPFMAVCCLVFCIRDIVRIFKGQEV